MALARCLGEEVGGSGEGQRGYTEGNQMTQTVPTSEDIKEILLQLNNFKSGLKLWEDALLCREGERIDRKLVSLR